MAQGPPSLFCPSLQLCWPSECLPASPRETAGRSPKATFGLLLWFKGGGGGEQRFTGGRQGVQKEQCSGCSHGNKTLGSPLGCAHSQVELWLGLGQYELCQEPF